MARSNCKVGEIYFAEIAQLVEHNLAKVGVASSSLVFRSKKGNDGLMTVVFLFSRYKLTNTQIFAHIVAQTVSNETSAKLSGTRLQPQWQRDLNRCIKYKEPFRLLVLSISSFMNNKTYTINSFNSSFNCLQLGKYRFNNAVYSSL